jgi:predicted ATP-grasp superfamily ATP-dependent carboligase
MSLRVRDPNAAIMITGSGRVTLADVQAISLIVNSRSVHVVGKCSIKHLLFQFLMTEPENEVVLKHQKRSQEQE